VARWYAHNARRLPKAWEDAPSAQPLVWLAVRCGAPWEDVLELFHELAELALLGAEDALDGAGTAAAEHDSQVSILAVHSRYCTRRRVCISLM
ncbi:MAG: hypothetical protein KY432_04845, partial [Acidobacteria bacterium]|nr:hypothetical protein [Acidobacteriota bacterium]